MLDYTQLEALLAVEEAGTFEGAGRKMNLSSFAIVQRIKALEAKMGVTLIERSPTRTSEAGKILCNHTKEVRDLESQAIEAHRHEMLDMSNGAPVYKIAISNEVLAKRFQDVLTTLQDTPSKPRLDVVLAAHRQLSEQMRSGEIVAALTTHKESVYGFKTYDLDTIEYRAVANPQFMSAHFSSGITQETLCDAPALRFCGNDDLIHAWMERAFGTVIKTTVYRHPSCKGSLEACLAGQVWSMQPMSMIEAYIKEGSLVELIPNKSITRQLYWHVAGTMVEQMKPVTNKLRP